MRLKQTLMLGAALTALGGCSRSDLLGVQTPDAITQSNLNSADGAEGMRVGAIQRFKLMTALDESSWFYGGMLVDEWKSADTFVQRDETDQRTVSESNSLVETAYRDIHRARVQAWNAMNALNTFKPNAKGEIGEMWFVKGYAELQSALDFCNGLISARRCRAPTRSSSRSRRSTPRSRSSATSPTP
jgi:starch-binding outer membrane protein, SusD/RagB family